jgi:hypothetical protein
MARWAAGRFATTNEIFYNLIGITDATCSRAGGM